MRELDTFGWVALVLVLIGGINWLLVGLFSVNLVTAIFGFGLIGRLILVLVGVAALYLIYLIYVDRSKKII